MDLTLPYWKRIWQTVTAKNKHISNKAVITDLLAGVGKDLCDGLVVYGAFTKTEFELWIKEMKMGESNRLFERFFFRVCKKLNLHPRVAWNVLCNFLMYEYYGKISDIEELARYETNAVRLIENIWTFYTSERMFLLKTMRFILEHYKDRSNTFFEAYAEYVRNITMANLRKGLLDELKYLIEEINANDASNCINMKEWIDRNNREQLETVFSIVICMSCEEFSVEDFVYMLQLFIKHDFANSPSYIKNVCVDDPTFQNVNSAELGAFLVGLENCWNNREVWEMYQDQIGKLILESTKVGDHSVLLLTWATLHASLSGPGDIDNYNKNYSHLPLAAFESSVFVTLNRVAKNASNFNCPGGRLILNSIFTLYSHVCYNFNDDDLIFIQKNAIELLLELFRQEELAKRCVGHPEQPIKSIFAFSIMLFPYNFKYLTEFATVLVSHEFYTKKMVDILHSLTTYAEEYNNSISNLESVYLSIDYCPVPHSKLIVFPKGTEVVGLRRFGKKFLIFKSSYSYFTVLLQEIILLLSKLETCSVESDDLKNVTVGYRLLSEMFRKCDRNCLESEEIRACLNALDKLANVLSQEHFRNEELMRMFFDVITAVSVSNCHLNVEIYSTAILPKLVKFEINVQDLFYRDILKSGILLKYLQEEEQMETHDLLLIYIEFVRNAFMKNVSQLEVQLPGLIYLLRTVFPNHHEWKYSDIAQRYKITNECLTFLLRILSQSRQNIVNDQQKLIFDFCLEASLNDDFTVKGYTNIFKMTNSRVQLEMEKETNWENGRTIVLMENVKILFTLILLLMKYNRYGAGGCHCLLRDQLIYTTVHGASIVKVVAGYIHHPFEFSIQKLAVRVLKNWAMDASVALFGPLEWDSYQLQRFFLEKLRDPFENDDLKLAIIDLIGVSIQHQPGLTGAFFNVKSPHKRPDSSKSESENGESVADFMIDYLQNVKKSADVLKNPLQYAILDVIHKLWDSHKAGLIQNVVNLQQFWSILADPVFHDIKLDNKLYGLIFGIFSMEFHDKKRNASENFLYVLKTFLDPNEKHLIVWRNHLVAISEPSNTVTESDRFNQHITPSELYLLNSWRSFLMLSVEYAPDFYEDDRIKESVMEMCLDALLCHFSAPSEMRVIRVWSEIYLFCISRWADVRWEIPKNLLVKLTDVLEQLINYYLIVDDRCRETILAASSKTVLSLRDFMNRNPALVDKFLAPLGKILDVEYKSLHLNRDDNKIEGVRVPVRTRIEVPKQLVNWVLVLSIGNNLLTLENIETHSMWFDSYQFLHRTLSCIGPFIRSGSALPVAKIAVQTLIIYIQSPLAKLFLTVPLHSFYDEIIPPVKYINHTYVNEKTATFVREWWVTYGEIIKLHNLLLNKFGCLVTKECFSFLFVHDEILAASIKLTHVTVDPAALSLVCLCLQFCNTMLVWKDKWIMMNSTSFYRIANAVQETINAANSLILKPKTLAFFSIEEKSVILAGSQIPTETLSDILNMLIQIITLSLSCLTKSDPDMLQFLDATNTRGFSYFNVEFDFHVPMSIQSNTADRGILTYGGLICLLQFLCKMLTKLSVREREKANFKATKAAEFLRNRITESANGEQPFIGLVQQHNDVGMVPHTKVKYIQHYTPTGELSFLQVTSLNQIDPNLVRVAIEMLTTFLALQVYVDVTDNSIAANLQQYIKRELHSELQFFIEFVKKRMYEQFDSSCVLPSKMNRRNDSQSDTIRLGRILSFRLSEQFEDREIQDEYLYLIVHWFCNICQLNN